MFKLNLKIALRNLWKNKIYTLVNIFGLAIGLAGFILILLYINKETGYDKWDPALSRTYMAGVDAVEKGSHDKGSVIKGIFTKMLNEQFPEIEAVSQGSLNGRSNRFIYHDSGKAIKIKINSAAADSNFLKVYPLKAIYGRMEDVFATKNAIAISLSKANELFGTQNPINKELVLDMGSNFNPERQVIKAVWDDLKQPSFFDFGVLFKFDLNRYGVEALDRSYSTMFRIRAGADQKAVLEKINRQYLIEFAKRVSENSAVNFKPTEAQARAILKQKQGITSIAVITEQVTQLNMGTFYSNGAKQTSMYVLSALAAFLILISCINYTNLALVLAQGRAKEVGIKKVMGAFKGTLMRQFFMETAIQCIVAYLLSLILAELLLPAVNQLVGDQLSLFNSVNAIKIFSQAFALLMAVVIIAGLYPAVVLSGFLPAKVLKGNFSTAKHIGLLRRGLVVFQFTIAIALVISFLVIEAQLNFMKNKDLGMNPDQLMNLTVGNFKNRILNPSQFQSIKSRLMAIHGVEDVTRATDQVVNDYGFEHEITHQQNTLKASSKFVDPNYFSVIGAKIKTGRDFSAVLQGTDSLQSIIINETAYEKLNLKKGTGQFLKLKLGDSIKRFNLIGVVKDIQIYGFDQKMLPTIYLTTGNSAYWRTNVILRLKSSEISETIATIRETWKTIEPGEEPSYTFADENFSKLNTDYETSGKLIFAFGMLTLLISVLGLVGFAAFSAKIRTKEVAVRRILGVTTQNLLQLLNKDFIKLVFTANIFADLLAWFYMNKWFSGFAYRTEMPYAIFILANIGMILLTIVIVSFQSLRAIRSNPAQMLKYE